MKRWTIWALLAAVVWGTTAAAEGITAAGTRNVGKRYLVAFKADVSAADKQSVLAQMGLDVEEALDEIGSLVAEGKPGKVRPNAAFQLLSNPKVAWVEEDTYWPNLLVDMPMAMSQLPLPAFHDVMATLPKVDMPGQTVGETPWGIRRVNAPGAWSKTQGEGVRVAVIDTGIYAKHPDLAGNYAGGYNAIDSDKEPNDDNGHGTHVAGTIAAIKDDKGVVGVAPKAKLFAVKVLDAKGGGSLVSIVKGLIWCGRNNIQVANMSLGAPIGTFFMHWAVMYANMKGVAIVAAAGNSGGKVSYPGGYPEVIAVSAADAYNKIAPWSSRGKQVAVIAPGVDVLSLAPGGGMATHSGTSMATPHVAGLAALAVTQNFKGSAQIKQALQAASTKLEGLKPEEQGAGMPDAAKLLRR
ncbi:MAG: S8 family peptidase [Elusimicrobia bacterium]|nr:S8 family peptidase [Elusimicrobiota bacterium]